MKKQSTYIKCFIDKTMHVIAIPNLCKTGVKFIISVGFIYMQNHSFC